TPAFRVELERVLTTDVLPALRGYRDFLERDYLPRARRAIGVSANPDGAACYRASIRATTGLDLSPDAVHRLGIATVAALEGEMRVIARRSFSTRDVGVLLERLRTAPAFTFHSRRAMLDAARGAVLRAKAAMPAWFGRLPRAAAGRDATLLVRHGAARRPGRPHALGRAARGGHRHQRVRMVAGAGDRLHPRPHARPAAARGSARGSLPDLAGPGPVLCAGAARAATAALRRRARMRLPFRHQGVPRPR